MTKFDFSGLFHRLSTWFGMLVAAAAAVLGFYESLPGFLQAWVPEELLAFIIFLAGMAVPAATSFKQRGLAKVAAMRPNR